MRRPDFFVVGAPKCGTTALCSYLADHPRVFMCEPKEPHYFADDFPGHRQVRELERYLAFFGAAGPGHCAVGEGSVWYLYSSRALRNIRSFNPLARIIVMLRNPIDLVVSLHQQQCYSLYEDQEDLARAWALQTNRLQGKDIPRLCRQPELLQYGPVARLGEQLERLLDIFPPQQVLAILYDDFAADAGTEYRKVLRFLDVPDDGRDDFAVVNRRKEFRSHWLHTAARMMPMALRNVLTRMRFSPVTRWLPELLDRTVATPATGAELSPRLRLEMRDYFRDDVALLEELLGRDLSHWLEASPASLGTGVRSRP